MTKKLLLNRKKLLEQLPSVKYEKTEGKNRDFFEKMSLSRTLLALAEIDHEHEYELCRSIAAHLLENVPQPDEIDFEEE